MMIKIKLTLFLIAIIFLFGFASCYVAVYFRIVNDNGQTLFEVRNDDGRTGLSLYPSSEKSRVKISFRSNPNGNETQHRPLSIETHEFGDFYDPNHRDVTFYTDTTERFKKAFQWHWGLDFEDNPEIEFFTDLYPSDKYNQPYDLGNSEKCWNKTYTNILHLTPREEPETAELGDIYLGLNYKLYIYTLNGWK